ncbi:permease component of ABC-type sugar transporter [Halobacteroides halobius DSM 5150]|uniref:Permease component of ABC-type sugar transporter n=1 Tax=Halobacteroides halobius (strain ATCC 35273 / DSM 5150 / MD-1) TaxID=748449 RepID=L0KAW9_HALHC|nr:sugar ABC transporter permease [Halobacteroides halobius]AGB41685.1 permease component of ABC-type sugar transporter [Halobacteroides halobius DSM 5150]
MQLKGKSKLSRVKDENKLLNFIKNIKISHIAFILPALILNLIFFMYPLIRVVFMSFHKWPVLGRKIFLGLQNYLELLYDPIFWSALGFTFEYTLMVTPPMFIIAFFLALLVKNRLPGTVIFRSIYFLPVVISMVSCSLVWLWIYNDLYGILNYYLMQFGIIENSIIWMGQPDTSLPAISFMIVWKMTGFTMVILLAGLQGISDKLYEAARMDGANFWQKIRYITLPMLKPTIGLALVISVIGSVLAFSQFVVMTKGGPANSTTTIVYWIYKTSFKFFKLGYGAAMTVVLLMIQSCLSWLQIKFTSAEY